MGFPGRFQVLAAAAAVPLLGPPGELRAQAVHGSVGGTVTDATGAPLPGAALTLTSLDRGTVETAQAGGEGRYHRGRLLPGRYALRAERAGFKASVVPEVRVVVDTHTRVDLRLELGPRTEEVRVAAATQLLQTDGAEAATVLSGREATALPLLDRNFTRLLLLTPGAQPLPWQHASSENPQGSLQTMVQGQHFAGTAFILDGTDNRDPILGLIVINPTLESVAEAKVTTQGFEAEFGQATSAVVLVSTRSGANRPYGSLFGFYQDDRFQARNPFTQPPDRPLPEAGRRRFGGALGGPLRRDRWFLFGDYEGLRSTTGGSRLLTVPTLRAREGDLSEYGVEVFDPATGRPEERRAFPGAVIPPERISPLARGLLRLLPQPNRPGLEDNFLASGSERFDSDAFNLRLDGAPAPGWKLFARYSLADYRRQGPPAFGPAGGPELVTLGGRATGRNQSLALGLDAVLGHSATADARLGFFRYAVDVLAFDFGTTPAADLGLPGLNLDRASSGMPGFFVGGPYGFTFGSGRASGCNCPLTQDETQLQATLNLTRAWGGHTLRAGVDVRRAVNLRVPSDANRSGELSFSEDHTRGPEGGGLGLASLLLGDVTGFRRYVSATTDARERQWRHFYYVQDTWRATRRLTVSAGLRLEVVEPQTVNGPGRGGWVDLATGTVRVAGAGGIGLDGGVRGAPHWAPRLGAAWRAGERTVVRLGYGRSHDIGVFGTVFGHTVTQNLPVLAVQELTPRDNFGRVFELGQGPPAATLPEVPASGRLVLPPGVFAQALPDTLRLPAVDAWNVALQRQLGDAVSAELAWLGSRGANAFIGDSAGVDVNEPLLEGFPSVPTDERKPFFAGPLRGRGGPFGWTQRIDYLCSCGWTRYDALVAKLARRPARGWSLLAHYTLQRVRQDGTAQFFFDRGLQRGRPDWARTHGLVAASVAELPVLGGWQVAVTGVALSGLPFEVTYRGAGADRDVGPDRPHLVGDPRPGRGDGRLSPWFNVTPLGSPGSAFARPEPGTFGDLPRNHLTGPAYWRVDASLAKLVKVGARARLEVRLDAVNVFNHVNLGNPDAELGVPGNPNPGAGFITSTAYFGADPQRHLQLGLRLTF